MLFIHWIRSQEGHVISSWAPASSPETLPLVVATILPAPSVEKLGASERRLLHAA
jgi:hypothetical protein